MSESMADDAKVEDVDKGRLRKTLKQLRKEREEENAAQQLLEVMQQHVDEAHARAVGGSFSARVPRSSAEVRRVCVHHIVEVEGVGQ